VAVATQKDAFLQFLFDPCPRPAFQVPEVRVLGVRVQMVKVESGSASTVGTV